VCSPNYITEWLLNVIAGDIPLLTDHTLLHKKAGAIAYMAFYDSTCALFASV
jgi:hypothetical protein